MGIEIERKFLVRGDQWKIAEPIYYCQGYLCSDKERTVRVRIAGNKGLLTIKGIRTGMSRPEFEYEIPLDDARQLLTLCEKPLIEKYRRMIPHEGLTWEVDEFLGENQGLVVAEVELESTEEQVTLPEWVGEEVTDDHRYFNSRLAKHPFSEWNK